MTQNQLGALLVIALAIGGAFFFLKSQISSRGVGLNLQSNTESLQSLRVKETPVDKTKGDLTTLSTFSLEDQKSAQQKIATLESILLSKNDNDPRLDSQFKQLSRADKSALQKYYKSLPAEKRNERGTVIFILSKNLNSASDFDFLTQVLQEPPCLSLQDCKKEEHSGGTKQMHLESGMSVTLAYPELVTLNRVQNFLDEARKSGAKLDPKIKEAVLGTVRAGLKSNIPNVVAKSELIQKRLSN